MNLDADVELEPGLTSNASCDAFADDPQLGIASGTCYELEHGEWRQRHVTGTTVWGPTRAYRWTCLQQLLPLEERLGWDGIDEFKARSRGWETRTLLDLPFRHYRAEGVRDEGRSARWLETGRTAHYVGYRPSYLVLRALFQSFRDTAALACVWGYSESALHRRPRCADRGVLEYVRSQQRVTRLPERAREALGRRSSS